MLTELVTRLDRREWEPRVYCLGPEAHYAQVLRDRQIPVMCFGARGMKSSVRVLWQWSRELQRFRPELLSTWLFHANLLGRLAGRWAGVPRIVSGIRVSERRTPWHGRWDRWTNFLVERNVCVSRGVADFMEQTVGLDPRKTAIIPNAIDLERFQCVSPADLTPWGIPAGSRVLITIGRLEHQKGIDVLLDSASQLIAKYQDVHFLVVGDGPDQARLKSQAQTLGIAEHVHWAGQRNDVPELLTASTALVLPSRWEGMPNVVLEAMAAGKPIVATRVEGVAELVTPGVNGWLVAPERPQLLAEAIDRLLTDNSVIFSMGRESQRIVGEKFTIDQFVENYVQMFREITSTSR